MGTGKAEATADQFFLTQEDDWERASRIMAVIYNTRAFGVDAKGPEFFNPLRQENLEAGDAGTEDAFAIAMEAEENKKRHHG